MSILLDRLLFQRIEYLNLNSFPVIILSLIFKSIMKFLLLQMADMIMSTNKTLLYTIVRNINILMHNLLLQIIFDNLRSNIKPIFQSQRLLYRPYLLLHLNTMKTYRIFLITHRKRQLLTLTSLQTLLSCYLLLLTIVVFQFQVNLII